MSKRRSRSAEFLSRVLEWVRHEPDPAPAVLEGRPPSEAVLKRAIQQAVTAVDSASVLIGKVDFDECRSLGQQDRSLRRAPAPYLQATKELERALEKIDSLRRQYEKANASPPPALKRDLAQVIEVLQDLNNDLEVKIHALAG